MNEREWLVKADTYADIEYGIGIKEVIKRTGRFPDAEEMMGSPDAWIEEVMKDAN